MACRNNYNTCNDTSDCGCGSSRGYEVSARRRPCDDRYYDHNAIERRRFCGNDYNGRCEDRYRRSSHCNKCDRNRPYPPHPCPCPCPCPYPPHPNPCPNPCKLCKLCDIVKDVNCDNMDELYDYISRMFPCNAEVIIIDCGGKAPVPPKPRELADPIFSGMSDPNSRPCPVFPPNQMSRLPRPIQNQGCMSQGCMN